MARRQLPPLMASDSSLGVLPSTCGVGYGSSLAAGATSGALSAEAGETFYTMRASAGFWQNKRWQEKKQRGLFFERCQVDRKLRTWNTTNDSFAAILPTGVDTSYKAVGTPWFGRKWFMAQSPCAGDDLPRLYTQLALTLPAGTNESVVRRVLEYVNRTTVLNEDTYLSDPGGYRPYVAPKRVHACELSQRSHLDWGHCANGRADYKTCPGRTAAYNCTEHCEQSSADVHFAGRAAAAANSGMMSVSIELECRSPKSDNLIRMRLREEQGSLLVKKLVAHLGNSSSSSTQNTTAAALQNATGLALQRAVFDPRSIRDLDQSLVLVTGDQTICFNGSGLIEEVPGTNGSLTTGFPGGTGCVADYGAIEGKDAKYPSCNPGGSCGTRDHNGCLPDHQGVLCAVCAENHQPIDGVCIECPAFTAMAISGIWISGCVMGFMVLSVLVFKRRVLNLVNRMEEGYVNKKNQYIQMMRRELYIDEGVSDDDLFDEWGNVYNKFKILVALFQVMGQFLSNFAKVKYPPEVRAFMRSINVFNFNPLSGRVIKCATGGTFADEFVNTTMFPVFCIMLILFLHFEAKRLKRTVLQDKRYAIKYVVFLLFVVYPNTSSTVLRMLRCNTFADGSRYLVADYSIACSRTLSFRSSVGHST